MHGWHGERRQHLPQSILEFKLTVVFILSIFTTFPWTLDHRLFRLSVFINTFSWSAALWIQPCRSSTILRWSLYSFASLIMQQNKHRLRILVSFNTHFRTRLGATAAWNVGDTHLLVKPEKLTKWKAKREKVKLNPTHHKYFIAVNPFHARATIFGRWNREIESFGHERAKKHLQKKILVETIILARGHWKKKPMAIEKSKQKTIIHLAHLLIVHQHMLSILLRFQNLNIANRMRWTF